MKCTWLALHFVTAGARGKPSYLEQPALPPRLREEGTSFALAVGWGRVSNSGQ